MVRASNTASKVYSLISFFPIYLLVFFLYFITTYYGGAALNIWGANTYYDNWVFEMSKLSSGLPEFFGSYSVNLSEISAPEPISGYILYLITRFTSSSTVAFNILNTIFLYYLTFFALKTFRNKVLFILMISLIVFGYYEFILLQMTHRFKISVLFFMVSVNFVEKNVRLAEWLLVAALLTHFSLLAIIPLLFFFRKLDLPVVPRLSIKKLVQSVIILTFCSLYGLRNTDLMQSGKRYGDYDDLALVMFQAKFTKLSFLASNYIMYSIIILIVLVALYLMHRNKNRWRKRELNIFSLSASIIYIFVTLIVVGTSRLVQVYYIVPLIIYLANYESTGYVKRRYYLLCLAPFILWNMSKIFSHGPLPIFYNMF